MVAFSFASSPRYPLISTIRFSGSPCPSSIRTMKSGRYRQQVLGQPEQNRRSAYFIEMFNGQVDRLADNALVSGDG